MRTLLIAVLALRPLAASAQSLFPLIKAALECGGDDVVELFFEDGDSQTFSASQGGTIVGGVVVCPSATSPFDLRATFGIKALFNASSNASTRTLHFPVEAVAYPRPACRSTPLGATVEAA